MRKVIQLQVYNGGVAGNGTYLLPAIYAVCDDGTLWVRDIRPTDEPFPEWRAGVPIPQAKKNPHCDTGECFVCNAPIPKPETPAEPVADAAAASPFGALLAERLLAALEKVSAPRLSARPPLGDCDCWTCERERGRDMTPGPNQECMDFS